MTNLSPLPKPIVSRDLFDKWLDTCPTRITSYREYDSESDEMNPELVITFQHLLRTPHLKNLKIVGGYVLTYRKSMALPKLCMANVAWVPIPMENNLCLSHENLVFRMKNQLLINSRYTIPL